VIGLLDPYTIKARLSPAILAVAPALALVGAAVSWDGFSLPHVLATIAIFVILFGFADIARRRGKKVEPRLFEKQGGKPTTMMLRHRDVRFSAQEKARYLGFIAQQLNEIAPTASDEARDHVAADAFYERATTWLRASTGDRKRFNILSDENATYGFRRNLFALKWPALAANVVVVIIAAFLLMWALPPAWTHPMVQRLVVVLIIAALHAMFILTWATERSVVDAADQYARQLILSTENLMKPFAPQQGMAMQTRSIGQ
jgi:ABC-type multidrug transport system fused ATPase/permease subunit